MTTVEEDLLLNESEAGGFEALTAIDEDLLLGAGDVARKPTQESVDDNSFLDSSSHVPEQAGENKQKEEKNGEEEEEDVESEKEELDYDEEEDEEERRERTSRFASEKKGGARAEPKGEKAGEGDAKNKRTGIPSLFDKTITNNPMRSGDQLIGVRLRIEGEQERVFYPPPSFMEEPPAIVPRLPNGIPLIGLPSNHGRAGFGLGYQAQARLTGGGGVGGMQGGGQWDQAVAMFLDGSNPNGHSSRSRGSRKRRSSSYSSSSSCSSDSRSRSRSSSRSDRRRRDRKERRRDDRDRRDGRRDDRRDRRRHDDRRQRHESHRDTEKDSRRRREQSKNATIESVKALGLTSDYIDRVNEQKRKRDEIVRKKEERRHGPAVERKELSSVGITNTSTLAPLVPSSVLSNKEKMKAFLAVNVTGVQQLPTAVKKIEALATELGPIKKCWRSSDDIVSIIFNAHDKAKDFMIKYNGKVLSGLRISVSLEKKFLNLNEVS